MNNREALSKVEIVREQFSNLNPSQRYTAYLQYSNELKGVGVLVQQLPYTELPHTERALAAQKSGSEFVLLDFREQL